jgi:DNA transformation protein and related proteins
MAMPLPTTAIEPLVAHACEMLSSVGPCVAKRMFGGWGISVDAMNIGLIVADTLYLKTNAENERLWLAHGGHAFEYATQRKTIKVNYHTPPDEALDSPGLMAPWARLALEAAISARQPRRTRRKNTPPKASK